jgi:hypothetical protein
MAYGIRKGLEDIAHELKGIKNILSSIWRNTAENAPDASLHPDAFADEYISTEECATRLGISDQTIRNWISVGKRNPEKGWIEGLHYVNISPCPVRKAIIRIPWNTLVQEFVKNRKLEKRDFEASRPFYVSSDRGRSEHA